MTSIKSYKLIPTCIFNKFSAKLENAGGQEDEKKENNNNNRSIKDILVSNNLKTHFKPSTHFTAEMRFPKDLDKEEEEDSDKTKSTSKYGEGLSLSRKVKQNEDLPLFNQDARRLPEYSHAYKLKKSLDDVNGILEDDSLSNHMKIRIYNMFKNKYDITRDLASDGSELVRKNHIPDNKTKFIGISLMNEIIKDLPKTQVKSGRKLGNIIKKYIRWDLHGNILDPDIPDVEYMDLRRLMKIILSKNEGDWEEIALITKILKGVGKKLLTENIIVNKQLAKSMLTDIKESREQQTKYVAW